MTTIAATSSIYTVIVDYNRHDDTQACLASLAASGYRGGLMVIDNGSADALTLRESDLRADLLCLPQNVGFARAYNLGIRRGLNAGAGAVFVLNNDTLLAPDIWGPLLVALMERGGIISPRIYYAADQQRIWSDGFRVRRLTLEAQDPRRGRLDTTPNGPPEDRDYVTGCAMLVDRRVFEAVGLFDEGFFAYYEDLDFCLRTRSAGFRITTVPAARLWHKVARATGLGTPRREYLMARGSIRFYARHAGWRAPFVVLVRVAHLLKRTLVFGRQGRRDLVAAHLSGTRDGLRDVRVKS